VSFSDAYETAVESRMRSIVAEYQAEAEKAKRITNADAAAYEVKAAADAQAHAIQVQGQAQASAIKARADALQSNPNLVSLTAAEKWNGILPSTMVPGGAVPFLQLPK
jgi:regulator of protease activity HflC (stomatin/prohibitin superfamily)